LEIKIQAKINNVTKKYLFLIYIFLCFFESVNCSFTNPPENDIKRQIANNLLMDTFVLTNLF